MLMPQAKLTLNLGAVTTNYRAMQTHAPRADIAAVVKANAYGMGAVEITRAVMAAGCKNVYVANYDEALELRATFPNLNITVFSGIPAGEERDALNKNILGVVNNLAALERMHRAACQTKQSNPPPLEGGVRGGVGAEKTNHGYAEPTPPPAPPSRGGELAQPLSQNIASKIHLHVDTGMRRDGLDAKEWHELLDHPEYLEGLHVEYLLSHLACPDEFHHPMNVEQLQRFKLLANAFPKAKKSFASSFGVLLGPDYHFDQCRVGRALYGMNIPPQYNTTLQNAITLTAPILMLREVDRDSTVGYGATQQVKKGTKLAAIACGYADGIFRSLSSSDARAGAHFYLAGHKVPIVGRVSMDLITLDVSHVPESLAHIGAEVELAGANQSMDDLAAQAGTIGYELMSRLGPRIKRSYTD